MTVDLYSWDVIYTVWCLVLLLVIKLRYDFKNLRAIWAMWPCPWARRQQAAPRPRTTRAALSVAGTSPSWTRSHWNTNILLRFTKCGISYLSFFPFHSLILESDFNGLYGFFWEEDFVYKIIARHGFAEASVLRTSTVALDETLRWLLLYHKVDFFVIRTSYSIYCRMFILKGYITVFNYILVTLL